MSPCIYPNCHERVDFGSKPIGYCKLGKHLPLFLCPHCKAPEPNRSLAAHCRKCGKPISFVTTHQQFDREFQIQKGNLTKELQSFDLAKYGISRDELAMPPYPCFGGILLFTTNGRGMWLDYYHDDLLREFNFESETIAIPPFHKNRELFVFTIRSLFKVNLVTFEPERIFTTETADELIFHSEHVLLNDEDFFLLLTYNSTAKQTRLKRVRLKNGDVINHETFTGQTSLPVKVDKNHLFFYTSAELIDYDVNRWEVVRQHQNQHNFDVNIPPRFSHPQIYLSSNDSIFRINAQDASYSVVPVTLPKVRQLKFQVWGTNLVVAHSEGLMITTGRGEEVFNSRDIYIETNCTKWSPFVFGKYMAFSAMFREGEFLYLLTEQAYKPIDQRRYESILFQPAIALGHLFLVVKEQGAIVLKVYPQ